MREATAIDLIGPVRNSSKSTEVFEALRAAILSRKLVPGDALKEAHLARMMHVSQVPVREALLRLENLGLVCRVPDKGTTVTKLNRSEMVELVQVRAHLEDLAFRLAAKHITPEILAQLNHAAKEIDITVSMDDYFAKGEADLNFHRIVWHASGNRSLEKTLQSLCEPYYAFVTQQRQRGRERLQASMRPHDALVKALLTKKASAISAAVHVHISESASIPDHISEE